MIGDLCFYLGAPEPAWLGRTEVPLFVSYGRLRRLKITLPRSPRNGSWALDSRAFSELKEFGEWTITPERYVADVYRYDTEIGNLTWAAPQDLMCEPEMLERTGLSIPEHQRRTVDNYLRLRDLWAATDSPADSPFMLALQGDPDDPSPDSYHRCWDLYEDAGVDVMNVEVVGLGSVCRRQRSVPIGTLVTSLQARDRENELPLHGFGVKTLGLRRYGHLLGSADSQAWSKHARDNNIKHPDCTMGHQVCNYCLAYALHWRGQLLTRLETDIPRSV